MPPWPPAVTRRPPPPPVDCGAGATGTLAQVQTRQGVDQLWALGFRGTGIVVGMVDGGIDTAVIGNVVAGWPADWGSVVGWNQHAHMTATAVLGMAPDARLWDLRIWQAETGNPATDFAAFLGNALQAYRFAIDSFEAVGIPQILSNSWGLWNSANGIDYATNPASQIAQMVEEALDAGMLVVFSAGNCGAGCTPPARCGANDTGSSKSILGPNGHPRVITVGAANNRDHWCGYTSQGPAVLPPHAAKPDFCGIAQYRGYNAPRPDAGTSAAAAIVSGVIALMKQKRPGLTQDEARTALASTARDIRAAGFDMDSGAGVIRAKAAFDSLP